LPAEGEEVYSAEASREKNGDSYISDGLLVSIDNMNLISSKNGKITLSALFIPSILAHVKLGQESWGGGVPKRPAKESIF
jgi:hypothetical protein